MLNTTYTVGTAPYALVYTKQFDTDKGSFFTVKGLTMSTARNMSVQQQETKKGTRTVISSDSTDLVPGTTAGSVYDDRVYTVIQRSPYTSEADMIGKVTTHNALLQSSGFLSSVLAGEK